MNAVVVDTDVVSYLFKRDTRDPLYDPHLQDRTLILSFMALAELDRWALERSWGKDRRSRLDRHLRKFTIVYADRTLCSWWAETMNLARRNGRRVESADAWIAATALAADIPLITHNPTDYAGVDKLSVITKAAA